MGDVFFSKKLELLKSSEYMKMNNSLYIKNYIRIFSYTPLRVFSISIAFAARFREIFSGASERDNIRATSWKRRMGFWQPEAMPKERTFLLKQGSGLKPTVSHFSKVVANSPFFLHLTPNDLIIATNNDSPLPSQGRGRGVRCKKIRPRNGINLI